MASTSTGRVNFKPFRANIYTVSSVMWGGGVIAIILVSLRIFTRIKGSKRLYWDDFFALVAVILYIVAGINWQTVMAHDMYEMMSVFAGHQPPGPNFLAHLHRYGKSSLASLLLFYSTLWAVKFSFLIFFRRLGKHVRRQRLLWWPIFGFTITSYLVILGITPYRCLGGSIQHLVDECATESIIKSNRNIFLCCFIFDVFTDFAIMLIPVTMLWKVQMRLSKKLALAGIFSLVMITITFATIRAIASITSTGIRDPSWRHLWTVIEAFVALIISSVASFRSLFINHTTQPKHPKNHFPLQQQQLLADKSGDKQRPRDPYSLAGILTNISALRTHVSLSSDRDHLQGSSSISSSQIDHSLELEDGIRVEH